MRRAKLLGMNARTIILPSLIIDFSALRSEFSPDGYPRWEGKVVLTFADDKTVTANWISAQDFSRDGSLVDFEGDADENDPVYAKCEERASEWAALVSGRLGRPSALDAHHNDIERRKLCTCKAA